jgi:hypothetical protein
MVSSISNKPVVIPVGLPLPDFSNSDDPNAIDTNTTDVSSGDTAASASSDNTDAKNVFDLFQQLAETDTLNRAIQQAQEKKHIEEKTETLKFRL